MPDPPPAPCGETHTVPVAGLTSSGCKSSLWLWRAAAPQKSDFFISAAGQSVVSDLDGELFWALPRHVREMLAALRGSGLMMSVWESDGQISMAFTLFLGFNRPSV